MGHCAGAHPGAGEGSVLWEVGVLVGDLVVVAVVVTMGLWENRYSRLENLAWSHSVF